MSDQKKQNIENLEGAFGRLESNSYKVYFLTYDTKNNARAAIKYIYDTVQTLRSEGIDAKVLVEDKNYSGVNTWLGDRYKDVPVVTIKEDQVQMRLEDILVVPEYYSNVLEQLANVKCTKIMLVQQAEYIFETLPVGSRWSDYGFDKVITTTESSKKYIQSIFPESLVFINPPKIGEIFTPSELPSKPFVAISARDRGQHRRIISEFYLRYPQLRWVTFKDMVQMTYVDFADQLKECICSVWLDDESTFGTFPLESMKCEIPVIGKIPTREPEWLGENGMWTYDINKIVELVGTYVLAWLEGVTINDEVKDKMKETLLPYSDDIIDNNVISIFNSLKNTRMKSIEEALDKLKQEQSE
jgi:hypothetical protein